MTSPSSSLIDELAARAVIETDGEIGIISIPGIEAIPESQRIAVFKKAEQRLVQGHLDADALCSRLQEITPPPLTGEERDAEIRLLEAQARQDLESEGCAPCYPPHLGLPIRNPPEEYRQIIEYWQSILYPDDQNPFRFLETEVRKRRQRNGLDDDVRLLLNPRQQSRQQDWIEFQDFHLKFREQKTKHRREVQDRLEKAEKMAREGDTEGSDIGARDVTGITQGLEYLDRVLRRHDIFLQWIEQQRVTMDPRPPTPVQESNGEHVTSTTDSRDEPYNSAAAFVESPKSTPQITEPRPKDMTLTSPRSPRQMPKGRNTNPRRAKEKTLAQIPQQRVAKATRLARTWTDTRAETQRNGARQNRVQKWPQRSPSIGRPLRRSITTRNGRVSREPERWVPA
ncbi:hypothetical protein LTR42_007003 [Elasticomyces elasticus]|nr:hypothetical protein LTR42_007003 [Elasticomyces elasticus]